MFGAFVPLAEERMSIEDLRVFSEQIQFFSATCLQVIMQSLLLFVWAGKRVTTIPIWLVGAHVLILFGYERLTARKAKEFDCTLGYPGEDILRATCILCNDK